jgi:hypothetical protein
MRLKRILCIAAVLTAPPSGAQEAPIADWPLAAGARVRILSPALGERQQIGNVASATWDTLVFIPVKRSTSTARSDTLTGGVLGGLFGAFFGAALGGRRTDTWVPVTVPVEDRARSTL